MNFKCRMYLSCFLMILLMSFSYAQNQSFRISGTVKDSEGISLPGATVLIKGSSIGVQTDFDGKYVIDVEKESTLVFSFIGLRTVERLVTATKIIDVTLVIESNTLDEVVLIGYGTAKKGELTGAVSQIGAENIKDRPLTRIDQALTGQLAGVVTRTTTGKPGEPLEIRIRGNASISADNSPLYVVDGLVVDDLNNMAPDDIQSIEVLKDAASTAIYGSRGSNGVILVTTKKGVSGLPQFSFSTYTGIQNIEKKMDIMNAQEWIDLSTEVINKRWVTSKPNRFATDSYEVRAAQLGITDVTDYDQANTSYMLDPRWGTNQLAYIDWQDEFYRPAPMQNYQLSARGGGDAVKYLVSTGYLDQEGMAPHTGYRRFTLNSNIDAKLSPKLKVGVSLRPSISWQYGAQVDGKDNLAHYMLTIVPVAEKEAGVYTSFQDNLRYRWAGSTRSPIGSLEVIDDKSQDFKLMTNIYMSYDFIKGLNVTLTGGAINDFQTQRNYTPTFDWINQVPGQSSRATRDTRNSGKYIGQVLFTYDKEFGRHDINAIAGYSVESYKGERQYDRQQGFANDDLYTFNNQQSQSVVNSYYTVTERMLLSYFTRVNYSFDDRYVLSASIRRDGSSRFGWDNLWGSFPAFGLAWRIDKEKFMESVDWLSNFKLRYSWGENGNNSIGDYRAFGAMGTGNYSFNGSIENGQIPTSYTNPDLTWEKTRSSDFGLEIGLLKNRFTLNVDYYIKKTSNLLLEQPVAYVTGYDTSWQNVGLVENKGLEFELVSRILEGSFKWKVSGNIAFNKNKVLELGSDHAPILSGSNNQTNIIQEGQPINSFYLLNAIGVLSTNDIDNPEIAKTAGAIPGDIKYQDYNQDGVIDEKDIHIVGKPNPDYAWGLTNTFSYKNFDLSVLFQGQKGGQSYALLGRALDRPGMGTGHNVLGRWRDRWISDEQPGDGHTPRIDGTTGSLLDTRWLYDATYVKLKNVTFGYNLPKSVSKKAGLSSVRLYLSLENMWRKDSYYGGYNPELAQADGTDYGAYPLAKIYTLGLNVNF